MTRRKEQTMAEHEEGPRAFSRFVEMIADGDAHDELSSELHALLTAMADHASATTSNAKGTLAVKFAFVVDPKGMVTVGYDVTVKNPKAKRSTGVLFLTKGNNLTVENPRQAKLPLRDVKAQEVRDAGDHAAEVRDAK